MIKKEEGILKQWCSEERGWGKDVDWVHCGKKKLYGWSSGMRKWEGKVQAGVHGWGKEGRRYVVIKRLSTERMKLQNHQPLAWREGYEEELARNKYKRW